jgi:four helix bundle protein
MAKYNSYEELPVWQQAARLYHQIQDLLNEPQMPLTSILRGQLERAALGVANQVASGYEHSAAADLVTCLKQAREAAAEIRSMMALISQRPSLANYREALQQIRGSSESCIRQISAWILAIQGSGDRAKRQSQVAASPEEGRTGTAGESAGPVPAGTPATPSAPLSQRPRAPQRAAPPAF